MGKRSKIYGTANERAEDDSIFPQYISSNGVVFRREPKRYGDNPHQAACLYVPREDTDRGYPPVMLGSVIHKSKLKHLVVGGAKELKTGKQGLSVTNTRDMDRALRILKYFRDEEACAVMKHLNPAGLAVNTDYKSRELVGCFVDAWDGDPRAAFGSVVVFTQPVDKDTAGAIQDGKHYVEVVAAPGYEEGVVGTFENTVIKRAGKKDKKVNPRIRVVEVPNIDKLPRYIEDGYDRLEMIQLDDGSFFLQEPYLTKVKSTDDVEVITSKTPLRSQWEDMRFSWYVCQGTRSNAVTIGKEGKMLAVGTGRQDRVGAIEDAIRKAKQYEHNLYGAVLASDGFMLGDNIESLLEEGISAVIQPGGSISDEKVIEACGDKIAMVFTGERCFIH